MHVQTETINRLLKKQSRAKGRRNALATAEDRDTPVTISRGEGEDEEMEGSTAPTPIMPTTYRWVSSVKQPVVDGREREMLLSFSIPVAAIPEAQLSESGEVTMDIDPIPLPNSVKPVCDVAGCGVPRKYRLVKDWEKGACGMEHLKVLESH